MSKLVLVMVLVICIHANFVGKRPDAIRCGAVNDEGAIFFAHQLNEYGTSHYMQVYSGENRYVIFSADGSYHSGSGRYDSRKGC